MDSTNSRGGGPAPDRDTTPDTDPQADLASVHRLPVPTGGTVDRVEVSDGELLSDADYARLTSQREQALARWQGYHRDAQVVARTVRTVATHQHTRAATTTAVRHVLYVPIGAGVIARRVWDARTNSRYERLMRTAEAAGDRDALLEWESRAEAARERRHRRRMDWLDAPAKLARVLAWTTGSAIGFLLVVGIVLAVASRNAAEILAPIAALLHLVQWIAWVLTVVWGPLVLATPWVLVITLWAIGRAAGTLPAAFEPAAVRRAEESTGGEITPSIVVTALRDLGIPTLRKNIRAMGDGGAGMLSPIVLSGCGVEVDVTLPKGVTTKEVADRRRKLAENLDRHEHEVFINLAPAARTVRLWIADSGALDEPIGPSPLVTDPDLTADIYTGRAPWGQNLRGEAIAIALLQRHLLITGLSNQGKTAALRALALWIALDPTAELRIADLKGIGDWHMFLTLATLLIEGPTDEDVMAATEMLEDGVAEMEKRLATLDKDKYPDGVTRDLARSGQGFHPLFLIVDEAQQAFMCPAVGEDGRPYGGTKARSRYYMAARKIHNQGRAVNVHLWQGTQDPTDQNLPKLVREGAHIRASLVVGTEAQARMALGDKAVNAGAAPHKLRQGLDKGTVEVTGDAVPLAPSQASLTVRTHFVDGTAATEIAERAKARRVGRDTSAEQEERDLLADVVAAMGTDSAVKATDVVARLRAVAPGYADYTGMTGTELVERLKNVGVTVRYADGVFTVRARLVLAALDDRDACQ